LPHAEERDRRGDVVVLIEWNGAGLDSG